MLIDIDIEVGKNINCTPYLIITMIWCSVRYVYTGWSTLRLKPKHILKIALYLRWTSFAYSNI